MLMHRFALIPTAAALLVLLAVGCGSSDGEAFDQLPPIRTTTSSSTTSTLVDDRRKFYEVQEGDNLAEIARSFQVPASELIRINGLTKDGAVIQIGQILEIPTDVVLLSTLPTIDPTATTQLP